MKKKLTIIFVHGWSVTNMDTYGQLPLRIIKEAEKNGIEVSLKEIFLSRYISFHDEVRLDDISRAFQTAIHDRLVENSEFICITHSTGGPVIRNWWSRYCKDISNSYRLTHLIMLAPANFGSALAKLGKGTLSRLKSWWENVEPGQGVLDWLELGSQEAWNLNMEWILSENIKYPPDGFMPFVLTGQSIDRSVYDALNPYTGEEGSDGVVRVASANLNSSYIKLKQPIFEIDEQGNRSNDDLVLTESKVSPRIPFRIISSKSHSGVRMGILNSVGLKDRKSIETVNAILECIQVETIEEYEKLIDRFELETNEVQENERIEIESRLLLKNRIFIHDRNTMIIFKVMDSEGYPINDFDLILTSGKGNNPNHLPEGFFVDRQQNWLNRNIVTYYVNFDILQGSDKVKDPGDNRIIREETQGIDTLGLIIKPRPDQGFVKYIECKYQASKALFIKTLRPNSTTMIEIIMQRVVDKEVYRLESTDGLRDFKEVKPSNDTIV